MNQITALKPAHFLLILLIGLSSGIAGAALWDFSGLGTNAQNRTTREYLMSNPEILPEAIQALQQKEARSRIEPARAQLEQAYPGAILGNPNGTVTLVEFSDYACGYCRSSVADVERLIAENPELKVVVREYPILAPESADAARMALAAADQGKFGAFHKAMFEAGRPSAETIAAAARTAGLDLKAAQTAIDSGAYESELSGNVNLARSLGFDGTPSWVVGDNGFSGAIGFEALEQAISDARS